MLPHILRRHMTGIYGRITRSEQRNERRLRLPQMEGRLVIAIGRDAVEVPVPRPTRVDAEFGCRPAEQHVPGALHVLGGERLPIAPTDASPQSKGQLRAVL